MLNSISLLSFASILMIHLSIVHPQIHWIAGDKNAIIFRSYLISWPYRRLICHPWEKQVANLDLYMQAEVNGCQLLACNPVTMSNTNPLVAPVL